MKNEQFLPHIKPTTVPTDLESAIHSIGDLVKKQGDSALLIKIGEIYGKLASYNITKSNAILEGIVVDIAIMMQKLCGVVASSWSTPRLSGGIGCNPNKVIYFTSLDNNGWMDRKELLDKFYAYLTEKEGKSMPVARSYKAWLNGELEGRAAKREKGCFVRNLIMERRRSKRAQEIC